MSRGALHKVEDVGNVPFTYSRVHNQGMADIPYFDSPEFLTEALGLPDPEQDGIASLHDVEAETGDERGLADSFDYDRLEAAQLGAALDALDDEPLLD